MMSLLKQNRETELNAPDDHRAKRPLVKPRIEYIDALRVFLILLVVYHHLHFYSYAPKLEQIVTVNTAVVLFIMPLFFFISGFLMYKQHNSPSYSQILLYLRKKFETLIIPTVLIGGLFFFLFNLPVSLLFTACKGGYWFTFTLFQFILISTVFKYVLHLLNLLKLWRSLLWLFLGCIMYMFSSPRFSHDFLGVNAEFYGLISMVQWRYFWFFLGGFCAKKYFSLFIALLRSSFFMGTMIFLFAVLSYVKIMLTHYTEGLYYHLFFILSGATGIILAFAYFNKYSESFRKNTKLGSFSQYIGKSTLSIYLFHYFFLPSSLIAISSYFAESPFMVSELFFTLLLSCLIIAFCLLTESLIRVSDRFGSFLLGRKG